MKKIAVVFGTRPEAIKMAPVVKKLKAYDLWQTKVVVTGQHREMLDQVLDVFSITPDYDLNIMSIQQSLTQITVRVLEGMERVFTAWCPDWILVHGDTTTAFGAALAAFYHRIPVAHVEAGLRTGSMDNPFPEEGNRKLTDVLTSLYFAPTQQTADNLRAEGVDEKKLFVTGNTVIDALLTVVDSSYQFSSPTLRELSFTRPLVLVTAHRRENWGDPLHRICQALVEVSRVFQVDIVFAMHKNPRTQLVVQEELGNLTNIHLIDAPSYIEFANLLQRCTLLVTDSGGLQEEAAALNKPVLVLRESTERPEGVAAGCLKLIGTKKEDIVTEITNLILDNELYQKMAMSANPYGDGQAAYRICKILQQHIK